MAVHGEVGNGLFAKRSLEFGHLLWGKDAVLGRVALPSSGS